MYKNLLFKKSGKSLSIELNRPKVFNALNAELIDEITDAVRKGSEDKEIRVVVLTGTGDKAFCSGADLKEGFGQEIKPLGDTLLKHYNPMIMAIRNSPKPIICRLNGVAAGAGMSLALACDMIIAREDTYMSELFVGIGLMPDAGSMYFLPRLVGMQKAFELFSTGRKIYMEEAHNLGLITKRVPFLELDKAINEMVKFYESSATFSIGQMKQVLNKSYESSLEQVLNLEAEGQTRCGFSADFIEGVMAFVEKREPEFKGK